MKNKKGMEQGMVFLFSVFFIALLFFIFFQYHNFSTASGNELLEREYELRKGNTLIFAYLESDTPYGGFSGLLIEAYEAGDFSRVKSQTSAYIGEIYGEEAGWELELNDQKVGNDFEAKRMIAESEAVIPGEEPIDVILKVSK